MPQPPESCDVAVVGAGILGLAVARELLLRRPDLRVAVLEREDSVAGHQTSHNSGVIHAGIYYAPGSLKARLCVEGARELYAFCDRHGIPAPRVGKLVVATRLDEVPALRELERRGEANRVPGLRWLEAGELGAIEPHVEGVAALHSPATGVVDFAAIARALAGEVEAAGASVSTGCGVDSIAEEREVARLEHAHGTTRAAAVVACAGAWSDRLAVASGAPAEPRIVPFRGGYLRLRPERAHLVRGLIYPVPDPDLPFLGVHLSRHVDGEVTIGPTALMVAARDAYRLRRVRGRDLLDTLAWPGTRRLVRRWWRTGLRELRHAVNPGAMVAEARRYVPELRRADVVPGPAGIRAQALGRDGRLLDDFAFSQTARTLHVRNAPSPAATSALAIAREICDRVEIERSGRAHAVR